MRISTKIVLDSETLAVLARESYEYDGPIAEAKGSSRLGANSTTADTLSSDLTTQGLGINSSLIPTLQNEVNNPIGFGQQTLDEMQTAGGQTAAGSQAAAQQRAALAAARTGNLASLPSVQDKLARSGAQDQSNNALGLDIANNNAKLKEQQEGIAGLGGLASGDIGSGLNALGLSTTAAQDYTNSQNWWEPLLGSVVGNAGYSTGSGGTAVRA